MAYLSGAHPAGFQALTVSTSATGTALTVPGTSGGVPSPNFATIRCETNNVRWRDDGTDPTATVGYLLQVGEILDYDGNLGKVKFASTSATNAALDIAYYRVEF